MSAPEKIAGHPVHPAAQKLPLMEDAELDALGASIKELGLKEPIVLLDDKILDGRNRGRACERVGVEPRFREATAEEAARPLAHVVAWNLDRRHLNPSQRALLAAEMLPELEREARGRQLAGLKHGQELAPAAPPKNELCICGHAIGQHTRRGCAKCVCEQFEPASLEGGAAGSPLPPQGGDGQASRPALRTPAGTAASPEGGKASDKQALKAARGTAAAAAAATVGASERTVQRAKFVLAEAPAHLVTRVREGKATLKQAETELRKAEQLKKIRVYRPPEGEFAVVAVDYPWKYEDELNGSDSMRGGCPYPPMTIEQGKRLKIPAAKDCILFLWITNAHLVAGDHLPLLAAWGFRVLPPGSEAVGAAKTAVTWVKPSIGPGHWLRGQTEHAILAIRGKPVVTLTNQSTLLEARRGKHSEKPAEFYRMVESLCPGRPRLEMFARAPQEGWTTTGAELPASKATVEAKVAQISGQDEAILAVLLVRWLAAVFPVELGVIGYGVLGEPLARREVVKAAWRKAADLVTPGAAAREVERAIALVEQGETGSRAAQEGALPVERPGRQARGAKEQGSRRRKVSSRRRPHLAVKKAKANRRGEKR